MGSMNFAFNPGKYSAFNPYRLINRETGFGTPIGSSDAMAKSLYCGMKPIASWDHEQDRTLPTGGVFNLEFSPEGNLLVAACEKKSIQVFDPLTYRKIFSVYGAHLGCVNCVKFLDNRMFATCSDDATIAIWDVRHLKKKIRSLLGHSNWVKNIEFSAKDQLLVTSGLEGSIYTWDINSYTECNLVYERVFHAPGLMRCRLSPDSRQMVMCTTGGLIVIVHDLNLSTLGCDLNGFQPTLYRLMQTSRQRIPAAAKYDYLFDRKRTENRVEFVSDFPDGNDAEVVSSLQIHPQGWTALSRNISIDDKSEWTCIHDIQPDDEASDKSCRDTKTVPVMSLRRFARRHSGRLRSGTTPSALRDAIDELITEPVAGPSTSRPRPRPQLQPRAPAPPSRQEPPASIQNDVWEASITVRQHRILQEMTSRGHVGRNFNMQRITGLNTGIAPPPVVPPPAAPPSPPPPVRLLRSTARRPDSAPLRQRRVPLRRVGVHNDGGDTYQIKMNKSRLLYYVQETNEGKGFIKELCYSSDGRIVCSPFGRGMRLLALNENCSELSHCIQELDPPAKLVEIGHSVGFHQDLVVSSKFSPRHYLLAMGSLEGKIVWYTPYLE